MLAHYEMVFMLPSLLSFFSVAFSHSSDSRSFSYGTLTLHFFPVTSSTNEISCEQAQTQRVLKVQTSGERIDRNILISNRT